MKVFKQKAWLADQLIKDYNITVLSTCILVFTISLCVLMHHFEESTRGFPKLIPGIIFIFVQIHNNKL